MLVALAPTSSTRTAGAIYGTALGALFAISALNHRWHRNPRRRRLNHQLRARRLPRADRHPPDLERLPATPLLLLAAGALLFFHGLVIAAAISHLITIAGWVVPAAAAP